MRKILIAILIAASLGACGDGQWGAELQLSVGGTDPHGDALAPGDTLTLSGGAWSLTLDRACLAVELAVITPAAEANEEGSDCFCHGDPPECHGDCTAGSASGATPDLVAELHTVVDLLAGPTPVLSRGTAPGDYVKVSLVLGGEHGVQYPPAACGAMDGRTLWVQGALTNLATAETWSLTVDLRAEVITEPIAVAPAATATSDDPALLVAGLRLDLTLNHVDFATVTTDATSTVTIGGDSAENAEAADEILHHLSLAESYTAASQKEE